jgi:hypothetical protein
MLKRFRAPWHTAMVVLDRVGLGPLERDSWDTPTSSRESINANSLLPRSVALLDSTDSVNLPFEALKASLVSVSECAFKVRQIL